MKQLLFLLCFLASQPALLAEANPVHREIRMIRRAYLDVTGLLPTPEEIDWYVVYNKNGYEMAVDYLTKKAAPELSKETLLSKEYTEAEDTLLDRTVLEKSIIYLTGFWKGTLSDELYETALQKFIKDALLVGDDNVSNAIDYMVNLLTCRPSSATEENELLKIFNKVSLKENELSAWKTVLLHIFEMHDCKYK